MAEVLEVTGRADEAVQAIDQAMALFQTKGATAYVERAEDCRLAIWRDRGA